MLHAFIFCKNKFRPRIYTSRSGTNYTADVLYILIIQFPAVRYIYIHVLFIFVFLLVFLHKIQSNHVICFDVCCIHVYVAVIFILKYTSYSHYYEVLSLSFYALLPVVKDVIV